MALRIVRGSDPLQVNNLIVTLFSPPGLGKTTLAFSADKPLLLDFDRGAYRAVGRKDAIIAQEWSEVAGLTGGELADYKTIVVDTVGRGLDLLTVDIIATDYKMGRGGSLTLPGYGALKSRFAGWLNHLRQLRKDIILIAHSEEQKRGEDTVERLDAQGASKGEIHKSSDAMGRLYFEAGQRKLDFSPSNSSYGKNPGQLPILDVPDYEDNPSFLSQVIQQIKEKINAMTAEQQAVAVVLNEWKVKADEAMNPEDFDLLASEASGADPHLAPNIKRLIWAAAVSKNYTYDKQAGIFSQEKGKGK